jgi:2-keto-4-pentenoate hydratase
MASGGEVNLSFSASDVASAFVEARRAGRAISDYPGEKPADLTAAYAIQDDALALWKREIGGWKVGRIGSPHDSRLGAERLAGPVFADTIVYADGSVPQMPIFEGGFAAVEAEFMLRLAPPPSAELPATNAEAAQWVDAIRIGIEIASSPYQGINSDGPCITVSDQGNNAGLVLGPEVGREAWSRLDQINVAMSVDDRRVGQATTATMLDGPFGAVRFLLANLRQRAIAPQGGWWVSSGAITGVHEIRPGSQFEAVFEGIGRVRSSAASF